MKNYESDFISNVSKEEFHTKYCEKYGYCKEASDIIYDALKVDQITDTSNTPVSSIENRFRAYSITDFVNLYGRKYLGAVHKCSLEDTAILELIINKIGEEYNVAGFNIKANLVVMQMS
jgi:hypothetical protein